MVPWSLLLERPVAPRFAWTSRLGDNFEQCRQFLFPTGNVADFLPCPASSKTGCGWKVANNDCIGTCIDGHCEDRHFDVADLAMLRFEPKSLALALVEVFDLSGNEISVTHSGGMIGWITPAVSTRVPVFIACPPTKEGILPLLQSFAAMVPDKPWAVILPSQDWLTLEASGVLTKNGALPVFMDSEISINIRGKMEAVAARKKLLNFALHAAGVVHVEPLPVFAAPSPRSWADIWITEENLHEICVSMRVGSGKNAKCYQQKFSFEMLGMKRRTKDGFAPTKDWEEFLMPIVCCRRVFAKTRKNWASLKTAKKNVGRILGKVFNLPGEKAFIPHDGLRCYEAAFKVCRDTGKETPLPPPPAPEQLEGNKSLMNGRPFENYRPW
jgi:hypothetical protein